MLGSQHYNLLETFNPGRSYTVDDVYNRAKDKGHNVAPDRVRALLDELVKARRITGFSHKVGRDTWRIYKLNV